MEFLLQFAVALVLFEGILIQCVAVGINIKIQRTVSKNQLLPDDLIGLILHQGGLQTTKKAGRELLLASNYAMSNIFQDRILVIDSSLSFDINENSVTHEYYRDGNYYIEFGSYPQLLTLFEKFGKDARRISLNYLSSDESVSREINKNIIKIYANYFTELKIVSNHEIWDELSNEKGELHFPNVKRFYCLCSINSRKSFDLKSIFPKLEIFELHAEIADQNCLANVTDLKELALEFTSIPDHKLIKVFENNKQISKLSFSPKGFETLHAIEKSLKNLKKLKIKFAGREFWRRSINRVYNLSSVTCFEVLFNSTSELIGDLSFDMPNLKRLELGGVFIDCQIADFINNFINLETVDLRSSHPCEIVECIEKLIYVKELITTFPLELSSLEPFFKNFDKTKSNLKTLKFLNFYKNFGDFEKAMNEINAHLKESHKPTWSISLGILKETDENFLMFECS